MANFVKHAACPNCKSKDNLAIYDDGSYFCFSYCGYKSASEEYRQQSTQQDKQKNKRSTTKHKELESMEVKSTKPAITEEEKQKIKVNTVAEAKGFRGIRDDVSKQFGVRYAYDNDEVEEVYYPCTQDGQLVGYKIREIPKNFYSKGRTGADCELFGQFKFNRGGKYVLLVEGEHDQLAAFQIMQDYNKSKGWDFETAVVSPTTGAQSKKQIALQYKFFDTFDNIILAFDNDKAGKDAAEEVIKYLPKGKVKLMKMRYKDPNEYLMKSEQRAFVSDFYDAEKIVPVGVLPSSELYERILNQSAVPKVPFPPFMQKLNEMFVGGMPLGHIINIAADTGIGKTVLVNSMVEYWIFNSPHVVGIVSMELDAGQYGESLLSQYIRRKLSLIADPEEKLQYLKSENVRQKANELFKNEQGDPRFFLLDNRDGTVEEIQDTIEELVVACGAKIIVLDPLQDILDGLTNEEQAVFMKWAKGFIKSHGITFVFINHMRKTPAGQNGSDSEQNIMGSSTIIKSASANILLKRDKMAEDPIVKNTTDISVTKNRVCGITGPAGSIYYENETHTLHSLDDWLNEHG